MLKDEDAKRKFNGEVQRLVFKYPWNKFGTPDPPLNTMLNDAMLQATSRHLQGNTKSDPSWFKAHEHTLAPLLFTSNQLMSTPKTSETIKRLVRVMRKVFIEIEKAKELTLGLRPTIA